MRFPTPAQRMFWSCRTIVWLAGWLVPARQRAEWRSTLSKQIWHWCHFLAESGQLNREKKIELAAFCWSAFPNAFWLRFEREEFFRRVAGLRRSPRACLGVIALAAVVVMFAGGIIPAVRSFLSSPIPDPDHVSVISLNGKFRRVRSETLLDLAAAWKSSKLLDDVAPYSWEPGTLQTTQRTSPILVARVAPDFFPVLDVSPAVGRTFRQGDEHSCSDCVILSNEIWRVQFHADPAVVGRVITLDGSRRTIIGVLPRNFHLLAPEIAVWTLLDSGAPPFSNFVERIGAIARTKPGTSQRKIETDLIDLTENAGYVIPASLLTVTSEPVELRRYLGSYLLFVLLAVGCATIIVSFRSDTGIGRAPVSARDRWRWWLFFVAKSVLLLTALGMLAWSVARWWSVYLFGSVHPMADGVALWLFLILSVAALSWAIHDQQKRCRVCLRLLGTPIQIGAPGHVLLDWSGTEMVCPEGHGVLYLPDSQANWLERDRWDNLDDSWAGLFREE